MSLATPRDTHVNFTVAPEAYARGTPSIVAVLRLHVRLIACCVLACFLIAGAYLLIATPVYRATASLLLDTGIGGDNGASASANYNQNRSEEVRSQPVLRRAAAAGKFERMETFAGNRGDVVGALQRNANLVVTPGRRSDVVTVSMASPYRDEARRIVDAIVAAYLEERVELRTAVARDVGALIERERAALEERRRATQEQLAQATRESGVVWLAEAGGNTAVKRAATISDAVTAAELRQSDLRARRAAVGALLESPQRRSAYIRSLQARGQDSGDATYGMLRQQLMTLETNLSVLQTTFGDKHPKVVATQRACEDMRQRVEAYEIDLAHANLEGLTTEAGANEQTLASLAALEGRAHGVTQSLTAASTRQENLIAELGRIERQAESLEQRDVANRLAHAAARSLDARVLEQATAGADPVLPKKGMTLAVALMAGAILGGGLALARETGDARLRSVDEIAPLYGARVLARIPRISNNASPLVRAMIVRLDSRSAAAEAYRTLRIMLHLGSTRAAKTVLVASPAGGDGKSTTASNLAIAFAEAGERTLLIDADLRGPVQHIVFEVDGANGLSRVLAGDQNLSAAIQPSGIDRLDVLPCGPIPGAPSEMLGSARFLEVLEAAAGAYDRIVIDSPPLSHAPDAAVLAAAADATVLVVRLNASTVRLADLAVSTLRNVRANLVGVVANDVSVGEPGAYLDGSWRYSAYARRFALEPAASTSALAVLSSPPAPVQDEPERFDAVTTDRPETGDETATTLSR